MRTDVANATRAHRAVVLAAGLMLVAPAMAIGQAVQTGATQTAATGAESDPGFGALIETLAAEAAALRISRATLERALAGLTRDPEVVALSKAQPEYERTVGHYVDAIVSPARIENGRARLAELSDVLGRIEAAYGVERHVLIAVWGIESNYGQAQGERSVIRSLATLMLDDPRRPEFWKRELLAALRILEQGDIEPAAMTGSWAGAMGHTQFMPTSYQRLAVDFDGDGRRDIWRSPADALASSAKYLETSGWVAGLPAAIEVVLPAGFDYGLTAQGENYPVDFSGGLPPGRPDTRSWRERGLTLASGAALPAIGARHKLRLVLPAGARGPAFLVSVNFNAILRYNSAVAYALAVSHLADRLGGGAPIATAWPAERGLNRAEREELQQRLMARGHNVGGVDGLLGSLTRTAIRSYQKEAGLVTDGHPGLELLDRLRQSSDAANGPGKP